MTPEPWYFSKSCRVESMADNIYIARIFSFGGTKTPYVGA